MPEPKTEGLEVTYADNLAVQIRPGDGKIVCDWDIGYMAGDQFVPVARQGYVFQGEEFDLLSGGHHFRQAKTNYQNIRDVMYEALKRVGAI